MIGSRVVLHGALLIVVAGIVSPVAFAVDSPVRHQPIVKPAPQVTKPIQKVTKPVPQVRKPARQGARLNVVTITPGKQKTVVVDQKLPNAPVRIMKIPEKRGGRLVVSKDLTAKAVRNVGNRKSSKYEIKVSKRAKPGSYLLQYKDSRKKRWVTVNTSKLKILIPNMKVASRSSPSAPTAKKSISLNNKRLPDKNIKIHKPEIRIDRIGVEVNDSNLRMANSVFSINDIINIDGEGFNNNTEIHFSYKDYNGIIRDKKTEAYSTGGNCHNNCVESSENRVWVKIPYLFGHAGVIRASLYVNNGRGRLKSNSVPLQIKPNIDTRTLDIRKVEWGLIKNSTTSTDLNDDYIVTRESDAIIEKNIRHNSYIKFVHKYMSPYKKRRSGKDSILKGVFLKNNWKIKDVKVEGYRKSGDCHYTNINLAKELEYIGGNNLHVNVNWSVTDGKSCDSLIYVTKYIITGPVGIPYF